MVTVADLMRECRNHFDRGWMDGEITITADGEVVAPQTLIVGQYIAVQGSALHDGIYTIGEGNILLDETGETPVIPEETFAGRIWLLFPPRAFIALAAKATEIEAMNPLGGYKSESLGGEYSYTKSDGKNGTLTWQEALAASLQPYRRMIAHVGV